MDVICLRKREMLGATSLAKMSIIFFPQEFTVRAEHFVKYPMAASSFRQEFLSWDYVLNCTAILFAVILACHHFLDIAIPFTLTVVISMLGT